MATLVVYADESDGFIQSFNATYATAVNGSNLSAVTLGNLQVGQAGPGNFLIYQTFVSFDTSSIDDDGVINSVELALVGNTDNSVNDFTAEARVYDWSTTVDTGDWRTAAQLSALTRVATWNSSGYSHNAYNAFSEDGTSFRSAINRTGSTRLVLCSNRNVSQTEPSTVEYVVFLSAGAVGTTNDPKLTIDWEAAPDTSIPVFMHHYRQQGIGG